MQIWRVNTHARTCEIQPVPERWERLGGRGLTARILLEEIPPACDPLSADNKLIYAPGLLGGHMLTSCDRISIGGKSPLTGGVKESNAGGITGLALSLLGIKALILEDKPDDENWWVLVLSQQGCRFEPASGLLGKGNYEVTRTLLARYGTNVALSMIGPGGEMQLLAAGISNTDNDHNPTRINARGGLGALMGSKHIKAVVIDSEGCEKPPIADPKAYKEYQKTLVKALLEHPQIKSYHDLGTAGNTNAINFLGALPTRGFSEGRFEHAEEISGEHLVELIRQRGGEGKPWHMCMPGCVIQCSNIFPDRHGKAIVAPIEYETIGLMGSNLGIASLDTIARLNWEVNDIGVDSIDVGAAIGVLGRIGRYRWGDGDQAFNLVQEIRLGSETGRMLGNGAAYTGRQLGVTEVPVVKNQAMAAYDPRAVKGTGVTYATSPMGADHTTGLTFRAKVDHLSPAGQVELSRRSQINMAGYDSLGACIFASFGFGAAPETVPGLIKARYGWEVPGDFLQELGKQTLLTERVFNSRAGFAPDDDRLPHWMEVQPLPPHNSVFDVPGSEMDQLFNW
jgi:aldehyde:ferredoxin oxidoreductase